MSIFLKYAKSIPEKPYSNFGDALSPIIVNLLSNQPVIHANFDYPLPAFVAIGTILQNINVGDNTIWGTGLDVCQFQNNVIFKNSNLKLNILATRGRITDLILKFNEVQTREIYGDPATLLCLSNIHFIKNLRLGIVSHFFDFEEYTPFSRPKYNFLAAADEYNVINPLVYSTVANVIKKIQEIISCSYIISSSFHGLILAEAFNIPCAFMSWSMKSGRYSIFDYKPENAIDHRIRDWYSGLGCSTCLIYGAKQLSKPCAELIIEFLEHNWISNKNKIVKSNDALLKVFCEYYNLPNDNMFHIEKVSDLCDV